VKAVAASTLSTNTSLMEASGTFTTPRGHLPASTLSTNTSLMEDAC